MVRGFRFLIASWALAAVVLVSAGENEAVVGFVYPCKPATAPIRVDGRLETDEWAKAIEVSGFTFSGQGIIATEQMVMRLLYSQDKLYLGVKCSESSMATLVAEAKTHDSAVWNDDCIEFFLDPRHDHEHYYQFAVNTIGAQYDAVGFDWMWNCQWQSAAFRNKDAWYVEAAVPFAAFELPTPGTVMGFNLNRERLAGGSRELYNWADVQANFHKPGLFGHLLLVDNGWKPEEEVMAKVARQTGAPEARVYVADGYWEVKEGSKPRAFTYSELIQIQQGTVEGYVEELRKVYRDRPDMVLRTDFDKLDSRYREVKAMASGDAEVTPEACAAANAFLNNLEDSVKSIYWKVRVRLLLEGY